MVQDVVRRSGTDIVFRPVVELAGFPLGQGHCGKLKTDPKFSKQQFRIIDV